MPIRKPLPPAPVREVASASCGSWLERWPSICEQLTACQYDDGEFRETATLVLSYEGGTFKAALNDRDNQRSLFVSGDSPDGVLTRLEVHLCQDAQEWRPWKGQRGGRGRK